MNKIFITGICRHCNTKRDVFVQAQPYIRKPSNEIIIYVTAHCSVCESTVDFNYTSLNLLEFEYRDV